MRITDGPKIGQPPTVLQSADAVELNRALAQRDARIAELENLIAPLKKHSRYFEVPHTLESRAGREHLDLRALVAASESSALAQPAPEPEGPRIYTASKTRHADKWKALRANGFPIISTWIDEAGPGETADFMDLWKRCVDEASNCTALVVYREGNGDILKGAYVETGAALARGVPVFAVGFDESFSFTYHPLVTNFDSIDAAIDAALNAAGGGR